MKKIHCLATLAAASGFFALASVTNAASIYWDGDQTANGTLDNSYSGNPNPQSGGTNGLIGSGVFTYFNTASDGSGTMVAPVNGDDLFFGFGSSVGSTVVLAGHTITGGTGTGIASLNLSPISGGVGDNYTFTRVPAWTGLQLATGATVDVGAGATARFDLNSIGTGTIGVKNGTGTLEYANGSIQTNGSWATNGGTFIVEQTHVSNTNFTNTGAGKIAYRGNATPAFGQEWDLRSTTSTFSGGFDLLQGQIRVGANSTGTFGAPTAGPLGTGTFTIGGEGDAVVYSDAGRTLHNDIVVASGPGTKTLLNAATANNSWFGNMTLNDDLTVETFGGGGTASTHNVYNVSGTGGFTVGDGVDSTTLRLRIDAGTNTYSGTTTVLTNSTILVGEPGVTSPNSIIDLQGGSFSSAGGGNTIQSIRGINGNGNFSTDIILANLFINPQTGDDSVFTGTMSLANTSTYIAVSGVNGAGGVQTFDTPIGTVSRFDVTLGAIAEINSTLDASAGATDIVVENDGILRGTGTLTGDVLVGGNLSQGILAPGNSIGTLNVIGNVDFGFAAQDGIALMEIDANAVTSDLLNITGDVIFGAGSTIIVENIAGAPSNGQSFDLLDWTGSFTGTPGFDFTNAGGASIWDTSNFNIDGTISVVPEPSTYALIAGLGILGLAWLRRRK